MKAKLWLVNLPLIFLFLSFYWITELGVQGRLDHQFLREQVFPVLSRARNMLTDLKFKGRGPQAPKHKIVVIEVDSPSLETLGRWPWHRDIMAYLIEKTFLAGAKVVGLDMVFSEADPRIPEELIKVLQTHHLTSLIDQFETDKQLEDVIRRYSDRLVLAWTTELVCQPYYEKPEFCPVKDPNALSQFPPDYEKFSFDHFKHSSGYDPSLVPMLSFVTPIANIGSYNLAAKHAGFINAALDSDGYIRRAILTAFAKGRPFPSLPLEMAKAGLGKKLSLSLNNEFRIDYLGFEGASQSLGVTPLGAMEINFRGPSGTFHRVSALDVLSEKDQLDDSVNQTLVGRSKAEIFKDAYVLIGVSAIGVNDMRHFPFGSNAPGVEGHANTLDNILSGDPLIPSSSSSGQYCLPLLMTLGAILLSLGIEKMSAIPALCLFLGVFSGTAYFDFKWLFSRNHNWNTVFIYFEFALVFVLTLALKYVLEERNKKFLRTAFSKYVAPQIVESILKDPSKLSLGGEKRELSILFSDIRGFTSISENMDAKALSSFLNDYLGTMTHIVFSNQGTLDKYIGDAVMAFWGAPLSQPTHAANSCKAAIAMMEALEKSRERFQSQYGLKVDIGIGINSGVVSVGNMGSEQTFEYTVIGDHVNLASRVEGLTKEYKVAILTTRFTLDAIQASGETLPPHRILDSVKVKGKEKAIELIQILEKPYSSEGMEEFQKARLLYRNRKWNEAIQGFEQANLSLRLASSGEWDGPCEVFISRCRQFQIDPPASDWDGSWRMESK